MRSKTASNIGPDLEEEGPNSTIPEDEFYDAVETGLEKIEEVRQIRVKLKFQNQQSQIEAGQIAGMPFENVSQTDEFGKGTLASYHALFPEISRVCSSQLRHALMGVSDDVSGWQLFAEEGEMKMYRREEEINGVVMDPLKSCHVVKGCTAREMCHYFFDPKYRNDWETTLEDCQILEEIAKDTLVFLQTHKRIWPANQRDALFWSHMRQIEDGLEEGAQDSWMVCNHSIESPNYPVSCAMLASSSSSLNLFPARESRKLHQNKLDRHTSLPDLRPTSEERREAHPRRSDLQADLHRNNQPRWMGQTHHSAINLQKGVPKVLETIHQLCSRHREVKSNRVLKAN